ncbi:MAG: hypothetical protein COB10_12255 [Planctomycetota bacterium]|nr:MAG: hypothetical protein COB10_12255 [Planctomycetota bacterium]
MRCNTRLGAGKADGEVDIADVIFGLSGLFTGGLWGICRDAQDANDDGAVNITDQVYTLMFLFIPGSSSPPQPFPLCGDDQTPDPVGCEQSTGDCCCSTVWQLLSLHRSQTLMGNS